ncbi:MAG TPA: nuclear transport factor 2 family protein [Ilumatobacteraceae bacterium]|nr:nuclear transport factor 2 family protein [Ilumatobacteraceae bacterium]
MSDATAARLARLEARVQRLEDERAIIDLLTSYGFAVDGDDPDLTADLFADDATVDIDCQIFMRGRAEIRGIVLSDAHQAILPHCAHVMGPFVVDVDGDHAVATGYATVYVLTDGTRQVWRQAAGRWTLQRIAGRWRVVLRESRALGSGAAQAMLRGAVPRPGPR